MDMTNSERHRTLISWPNTGQDTVFDYSFCVWPDEASPRNRANSAIFALFHHMMMRQVMEFTELEFNDFREELSKVGLTLREIERVPHLEPVGVI